MTRETDGLAEFAAPPVSGVSPGSAIQVSASARGTATDPHSMALAESAASYAHHCRRALTQFQATISKRKVSARELRLFANSLDRNIQIIEADLGLFCSKAGTAREVLLRAEQEHDLSIRLSTERELRNLEVACNNAQSTVDSLSRSRKAWISAAAVLASLAGVATFCAIVSYVQLSQAPVNYARLPVGQIVPATSGQTPVPDAAPGRAPPSIEEKDITKGADRLDAALGFYGSPNPEDVLRRVRAEGAAKGIDVCPFEWDRGKPSLLFGRKDRVELDQVMVNCADAVVQSAITTRTAARPPPR
jgi:hypothetical protein